MVTLLVMQGRIGQCGRGAGGPEVLAKTSDGAIASCERWRLERGWLSMKVEVVRNGQCSDIFKDTYNLAYGLEDF